MDSLCEKAQAAGLQSKPIAVKGRFHTPIHSKAAAKLAKLMLHSEDLKLLDAGELFAPVRSATDGKLITHGSLIGHIIDNTLLRTVDWNMTLRSSIAQLPESVKTFVAYAGFGSNIPQSLIQESSLEVLMLSKLKSSKANDAGVAYDRPEYPPHSIVIVGMAGRFPDADSVDELWDLLVEGKVTVTLANVERLRLSQVDDFANTSGGVTSFEIRMRSITASSRSLLERLLLGILSKGMVLPSLRYVECI